MVRSCKAVYEVNKKVFTTVLEITLAAFTGKIDISFISIHFAIVSVVVFFKVSKRAPYDRL